MMTGFRGTFVISWQQTEIDGVVGAPAQTLAIGSIWSWQGDPARVDGPNDVMVLDDAIGTAELRQRMAKTVRGLMGKALSAGGTAPLVEDDPAEFGFTVTDGRKTYPITLVQLGAGRVPLLVFSGLTPPRDTELWVVSTTVEAGQAALPRDHGAGVICFTEGAMIEMHDGPKPACQIEVGDSVMTKDNGAQQVLWVGAKRMTGARLMALPALRPIRIKAGALNEGEPDGDLLVSPHHRLLLKGPKAEALFNTPEVLVAAEDLIDDRGILVDYEIRALTYIHIMTEHHEIIRANGVETESFHPANTLLNTLDPVQSDKLFELRPEMADNPHSYGDYARRNLSRADAALFLYQH